MITQRNSNHRETLTSTRTQQRCAWVSEVFVLFVVLLCFSRSHYRQSLIPEPTICLVNGLNVRSPTGRHLKTTEEIWGQECSSPHSSSVLRSFPCIALRILTAHDLLARTSRD